jgi:hypothetical protein
MEGNMTSTKHRRLTLIGRAGVLTICAMTLGGLAVTPAGADPGNGNGAIVQRDPYGNPHYCAAWNQSFTAFWVFQCTIQIVTTPSGTVNEYLKGPVVTPGFGYPLPTSAVHSSNVPGTICDPTSGALYYRETVTPSGQVDVKCSSDPAFGS